MSGDDDFIYDGYDIGWNMVTRLLKIKYNLKKVI